MHALEVNQKVIAFIVQIGCQDFANPVYNEMSDKIANPTMLKTEFHFYKFHKCAKI